MPTVSVDFTSALVEHTGTKVGSGNVLGDGDDATYFQLTGLADTDSLETAAGYITLVLPQIADADSITAFDLTLVATHTALSGSPTKTSLVVGIHDLDDTANPFYGPAGQVIQAVVTTIHGPGNWPLLDLGVETTIHLDGTPANTVWGGSEMDVRILPLLQAGTAQLVISPRWYFPDPSGARVQGLYYEAELSITYTTWSPPTFDPPPGLPDGYSDWETLDLSTAVFFHSGVPDTSVVPATPTGTAYGKYDPDRGYILTNTGWPDFYFPGFELDPANDYYFQFVFDSTDARDNDVYRDVYIWLGLPDDPHRSYFYEPYYPVYQNEQYPESGDYHLFHLDSADSNWDQLSNGYTMPFFESGRLGVLAEIRWAVRTGETPPPEPDSAQAFRARARFWGQ